MSIWEAILWGIVQGATEFLPVSSSGHLVLVPWLLGCDAPGVTFDVIVHGGTLLAVVIFFWGDIWSLLKGLWDSLRLRRLTPAGRLALLIVVSAIPAALLGYFAEDSLTAAFDRPPVVAVLLLVTGGLLWLAEKLGRRRRRIGSVTLRDALFIGVAQCLALLPGISRSGTTMAAGMLRDLDRETSARFALLMAVPLIAGATGYELLGFSSAGSGLATGPLVLGFIAAALTGYLALHLLLSLTRRASLHVFSYYCWAFGLLCLIVAAVR